MQNSYLLSKLKERVDNLLAEISDKTSRLSKVQIYEKILKLINTDSNYVKDYLSLLIECTKKNEVKSDIMKTQLYLYKKVIPKDVYNKEFSEFDVKKMSSFEEIKNFFEKIKKINFNVTTLKEKSREYKFIKEIIEDYSGEIKFNSPITYNNPELYIYFLFHSYLKNLEQKIENYKNENFEGEKSEDLLETDNLIHDIESSYVKFISDQNKLESEKLLIKAKKNRKYINLLEGKFMKSYLVNFQSFITKIYDNFIEKFGGEFDIAKIKLLEKFMIFISDFDFEKLTEITILAWKYSFKDITYERKLEIIANLNAEDPNFVFSFEKEKKLKISSKASSIIIDNINDYIFENFCREIRYIHSFNESLYLKYVKISELDNHLYIKKIWDNFKQININIFNSETIQSLYKTLFTQQQNFLSNQIELSLIFDNINYILYPSDFKGKTFRNTLKILEKANMPDLENKDLSKTLFLSDLICTNEHEILGHFNIGYQNYFNKDKIYNSPIADKNQRSEYANNREGKESRDNLEIKLYGRIIFNLTLNEAIFILDLRNYLCDFNTFRKNFQNCNKRKLDIDDFLINYLRDNLDINGKNLPKNDETSYNLSNEIKKNNLTENTYYNQPKAKHPKYFDMDGSKIEGKFQEFEEFEKCLDEID